MAKKKIKHLRSKKMVFYEEGDVLIPINLEETPYKAYILIKRVEKWPPRQVYVPSKTQNALNYNERLEKIENKIDEISHYLELNDTKASDDPPEEESKHKAPSIWDHLNERIDKKIKEYEMKMDEKIQNVFKALEKELNEKINSLEEKLDEKLNSILEQIKKANEVKALGREEMPSGSVKTEIKGEHAHQNNVPPPPPQEEENLENIVSKYECNLESIRLHRAGEKMIRYGELYKTFVEEREIYTKKRVAVDGDYYDKKIDLKELLAYERNKKKDPVIYLPIIHTARNYNIELTEDERKVLEEWFTIEGEWIKEIPSEI